MLAFFGDNITTSDYMNLYFFHNTNEKCLSFLRKKDLKTGTFFYQELSKIDRVEFPSCLQTGVEATYFASDAYFDYVDEKYEQAIVKLRMAIDYTVEQSLTMPEFAVTLYELNLNILRVHVKERDVELVINKFSQILNSIFFSENNSSDLSSLLNELSGKERKSMATHIINNVIFSISELRAFNPDVEKLIYKKVLKQVFVDAKQTNINELQWLYWDLQTIYFYLDGNTSMFLERLDQSFTSFGATPFYVRKMLLSQYLESQEVNREDILAHPYYQNFAQVLKEHNFNFQELELVN